MHKIIKNIGIPAVLEQTAEECVELSQACLKLSRRMRNENPTPQSKEECIKHLLEEIADVKVCLYIIDSLNLCDNDKILSLMNEKILRWKERIKTQKPIIHLENKRERKKRDN